jgi:hypothetical protein
MYGFHLRWFFYEDAGLCKDCTETSLLAALHLRGCSVTRPQVAGALARGFMDGRVPHTGELALAANDLAQQFGMYAAAKRPGDGHLGIQKGDLMYVSGGDLKNCLQPRSGGPANAVAQPLPGPVDVHVVAVSEVDQDKGIHVVNPDCAAFQGRGCRGAYPNVLFIPFNKLNAVWRTQHTLQAAAVEPTATPAVLLRAKENNPDVHITLSLGALPALQLECRSGFFRRPPVPSPGDPNPPRKCSFCHRCGGCQIIALTLQVRGAPPRLLCRYYLHGGGWGDGPDGEDATHSTVNPGKGNLCGVALASALRAFAPGVPLLWRSGRPVDLQAQLQRFADPNPTPDMFLRYQDGVACPLGGEDESGHRI